MLRVNARWLDDGDGRVRSRAGQARDGSERRIVSSDAALRAGDRVVMALEAGAVVAFKCFGELVQGREEFGDRFGRQVERQTHERQVVGSQHDDHTNTWFHSPKALLLLKAMGRCSPGRRAVTL